MGAKPRPVPLRRVASRRVRATVRVASSGGGPLYVDAPSPLLPSSGSQARFSARGQLAGVPFRGAFIPLGGRLRMVIPQALASMAGLYDGARVTLEVQRVAEPAQSGEENPWTLE